MGFGLEVDVDLGGLEAMFSDGALDKAQDLFAERVADDCNRYCPEDTRALHDSLHVHHNTFTGEQDYADYAYNADSVRTDKNPDAQPAWPEHAKSAHLDEWCGYAGDVLMGGGSR